jgi:NADPH-dependent glutamate synthase beta subunit-like oxidoreductase
LAAPEELARLAKGIADKLDEKTLTTLKREFLQAAERTVRYEARVGPAQEEDVDQQTQSMLGNVVNTLGRGVDNVVDFFRQ